MTCNHDHVEKLADITGGICPPCLRADIKRLEKIIVDLQKENERLRVPSGEPAREMNRHIVRIGFMKALVTANPESVRGRVAGWEDRLREDADRLMRVAGYVTDDSGYDPNSQGARDYRNGNGP